MIARQTLLRTGGQAHALNSQNKSMAHDSVSARTGTASMWAQQKAAGERALEPPTAGRACARRRARRDPDLAPCAGACSCASSCRPPLRRRLAHHRPPQRRPRGRARRRRCHCQRRRGPAGRRRWRRLPRGIPSARPARARAPRRPGRSAAGALSPAASGPPPAVAGCARLGAAQLAARGVFKQATPGTN